MAIYLEFDGISGDVTAEGYTDQIELDSMAFGCSRDVSMEPGNMKNREAGMPHLQSISISKQLDSATPLLLQKALTGAESKDATITIVRTGEGGAPIAVGTFVIKGVIVSDYDFAGSPGARPQESLQLSYAEIEVDFSGADTSGKNGKNVKVGYDLVMAKSL